MIHATEQEIKKLKRVDVSYEDSDSMSFTPDEWLLYRAGIIRNVYARGKCKIRFRK